MLNRVGRMAASRGERAQARINGQLYAQLDQTWGKQNWLGAFVMMGVWFWTLLLFQGAFPFVWGWGLVWALWAAHRKNERRRAMEAYVSGR